jgi:hypothetical protein
MGEGLEGSRGNRPENAERYGRGSYNAPNALEKGKKGKKNGFSFVSATFFHYDLTTYQCPRICWHGHDLGSNNLGNDLEGVSQPKAAGSEVAETNKI